MPFLQIGRLGIQNIWIEKSCYLGLSDRVSVSILCHPGKEVCRSVVDHVDDGSFAIEPVHFGEEFCVGRFRGILPVNILNGGRTLSRNDKLIVQGQRAGSKLG